MPSKKRSRCSSSATPPSVIQDIIPTPKRAKYEVTDSGLVHGSFPNDHGTFECTLAFMGRQNGKLGWMYPTLQDLEAIVAQLRATRHINPRSSNTPINP